MLSAVENFGPAAAAAPPPHVYAHHHPFAIAAAAAAAGSAAAAAAAVMPSQSQSTLEHYTIAHSPLLSSQQTFGNTGIFLPSSHLSALPPSVQGSPTTRSTQLSSETSSSVVTAMSSTEFARPHPKQPRYSSSSNSNNNSNSSNNNNSSISNNNISSSNGIPLSLRSTKVGSNCMGTNISRTKYPGEQSGPVNLATNNNNNNNNDSQHNNNNSTASTPPSLDTLTSGCISVQQSSSTDSDVITGIYAQKLPFTTPTVVTNAAAVAAAYQFNYPHLYGRGAIYGTPALYPSHHPLSSRSQLHSRPTYIAAQHEPFSPYLPPPATYSPPSVPPPAPNLLRPPPPSQSLSIGTSHPTASLLSTSHNSNNSSLCAPQMPIMPERQPQSLHQVPPSGMVISDRTLPLSREKEQLKNSSIYPNGKLNSSSSVAISGFKVPCGKEGSLKHRILTRPPYSERDTRRRSPITATVVRSTSGNSAPSNFTKGAFIELSNGVLRKVEDMRTEDFIQSAEKSPHHQLADSTVVKIVNTPNSVIITFSYDKNRSKADVEVSQDHPFFVYGQGWASCNPELSMQTFGLKCQRLQVGDVCISLRAREPPVPHQSATQTPSPQSSISSHLGPQLYKDELSPQNLSRKPHSTVNSSTIPTTATSTAVTSRLSAPVLPHLAPPSSVPQISAQSYEVHSYQTNPPTSRHYSSPPSSIASITGGVPHHSQGHHVSKTIGIVDKSSVESQNSPPPSFSAPSTRPPSNQPFYLGTLDISRNTSDGGSLTGSHDADRHHLTLEQQAAVEASLSRKRRWSAPDNICDDGSCQPTVSKTLNIS